MPGQKEPQGAAPGTHKREIQTHVLEKSALAET